MLRLPINLLVTSDRGLAAYEARLIDPDADPFDMRQIAWLGRTARPSTSVSALAFRNAREAAPSRATPQYFGLGHNQPVGGVLPASATPGGAAADPGGACPVDIAPWHPPVSAADL